MIRREFLLLFSALAAQPAVGAGSRLPTIGWLSFGASAYEDEGIEEGLREHGLVDGRSMTLLHWSAARDEQWARELAQELVQRRVVVILAPDPPAALAARAATRTIPIVVRMSSDPVSAGLAETLGRPGGNVTGVYSDAEDLAAKRLELLHEAVPRAKRIAVLWDSAQNAKRWYDATRRAADAIGVELLPIDTRGATPDFDAALRAAARGGAQALITLRNPAIVGAHAALGGLALRYRLPAMFDEQLFVEAGGLMSYGADLRDVMRHLASYVDKILKGARAGDLAIEQPTKFELVISAKTARALAIEIPRAVLLRADRVIE